MPWWVWLGLLQIRPVLKPLGTNYRPLHGYWSHCSLNPCRISGKLPSPPPDLDFSPFSTLAWCEQSGFGWRSVLGFVSQGLQDFLSPFALAFPFFFAFLPPFNQTERMRRLYPRRLHAGVHLNWICLELGWLILGGRPLTATSLSLTAQTHWPHLKFQVRIKSNNLNLNQNFFINPQGKLPFVATDRHRLQHQM